MKIDDIGFILQSCNCEIVSFIGVIEHLTEPRTILKRIVENRKIKYMFVSLPLFFLVYFLN